MKAKIPEIREIMSRIYITDENSCGFFNSFDLSYFGIMATHRFHQVGNSEQGSVTVSVAVFLINEVKLEAKQAQVLLLFHSTCTPIGHI